MHVCLDTWGGVRAYGTEVTGLWELPSVVTRNPTLFLWKNSKCSKQLSWPRNCWNLDCGCGGSCNCLCIKLCLTMPWRVWTCCMYVTQSCCPYMTQWCFPLSILASSYVVHTGLELTLSASVFLVLACWGYSVDYHILLIPLFITSREYSLSMHEIPRPMTIKIGP